MSDEYEWDIFVSHATEDKNDVALPLTKTLKKLGLRVWLDSFEISIGDSLTKSIDCGLKDSRFGIVIISKNFLKKSWTDYELRSLIALSLGKEQKILPIWHGITRDDVLKLSPALADIFALDTKNSTIMKISLAILKKANPHLFEGTIRRLEFQKRIKSAKKETIAIRNIKQAPIIHGAIPEQLALQLKLVWLVISAAYPCSYDEWIDGFRRDSHPSNEILVWNRIATAYLETQKISATWSIEKANAVLSVLLANSFNGGSFPEKISAPPLTEKEVYDIGIRYRTPFPTADLNVLNRHEISDEGMQWRENLPDVENFSEDIPPDTLRLIQKHLGIGK